MLCYICKDTPKISNSAEFLSLGVQKKYFSLRILLCPLNIFLVPFACFFFYYELVK